MKKQLLFGMAMLLGLSTTSIAQERFLDEVFTDQEITVIKDQPYSINVNWLLSDFSDMVQVGVELTQLQAIAANGNAFPTKYFIPNNPATPPADSTAVKISLQTMDIYMPTMAADTMAERPMIFYAHTGNFLPTVINGQPTGSKNDSATVEICKQFAKRGYVAIAPNYRLGWNPIAPDLDGRTGTLLNAVYRAIHDMKQAVRTAKLTTLGGNPFAVDADKVVMFGQGSGGYVALAYGAMTRNAELELDKFLDVNGDSYINRPLVGEINGFGGMANLYNDTFTAAGVTSDVQMVANIGGALADISWIEAGEPAVVSLHTIRDPYAPFDTGTVIVPTTQEVVVDVNGAGTFMSKVNALGNNDAFKDLSIWNRDDYSSIARARYGQTFDYIYSFRPTITLNTDIDGLFPIDIPKAATVFENTGAPWEWWNPSDLQAYVAFVNQQTGANYDWQTIDANGLFSNPNAHDKSSALKYIDTIQTYLNPRIMMQLEIGDWEALSVNELEVNNSFTMFPNPATQQVTINAAQGVLNSITIYDVTGKIVLVSTPNTVTEVINIGSLTQGMYMVEVNSTEGVEVEKLIIK